MAHCPSKCNCSECKDCKSIKQDGVEIGRRCKIDNKEISFWGTDKCPK
jgi:hypothetical protein